jgi:hypothetical protein
MLFGTTNLDLVFKDPQLETEYQQYFHKFQLKNLAQSRMCMIVFLMFQMLAIGGYFSCAEKLSVVFVGTCDSLLKYLCKYLLLEIS